HGEHDDHGERDQHDTRLQPVRRLAAGGALAHPPGAPLVVARETRVVLVDVELAVEAQVVRVGAQEALDVGLRRQEIETFVLERAQILAADLRPLLRLGDADLPPRAGLAKAAPDLEHGPKRSAVTTSSGAARRTRARARR